MTISDATSVDLSTPHNERHHSDHEFDSVHRADHGQQFDAAGHRRSQRLYAKRRRQRQLHHRWRLHGHQSWRWVHCGIDGSQRQREIERYAFTGEFGVTGEAASAWYNSIVDVHQFTTNFSFQISGGTSPQADGFAFVMQSGSTTAIGSSGGSLRYGSQNGTGLPNSIAIKFDIDSNNGEGTDSTGLYVKYGAAPTTPALDMTSSGVN